MNVEIEAKLKVESLVEIAMRVSGLGGEFQQKVLQKDCYFDDSAESLLNRDKCLRVRRQSTNSHEKAFLTYKGPKEKTRLKKRQEINVAVEDADSAEKLAEILGYEKALSFEKKREIWQLDNCQICLDELPLLGSFVEIEGPDEEKITRLQKKLGLGDVSHIPKSYATLMREELERKGISRREIFFNGEGSALE
jgi:adenylate cyclase class 2